MFIVAVLIATPAHADITTGLVGYWKFDEGGGTTAADSAGSNTGTLVGSPTVVQGKSSLGLNFNGTTSYVLSASSPITNTSAAFTISAWVNVTAFGTTTGGSNQRVLCDSINVNSVYQMNLGNSINTINAFTFTVYKSGVENTVRTTAGWSTGTWYLVTMVWDGSAGIIYVNGTSQPLTSDSTFAKGTTDNVLHIGNRSDSTGNLNGKVDDVRIYSRALTASDVADLYHALQPNDGLVAWWTFDEGSGTTVRDPIGNITGTLSGATKPTFVSGKSGQSLSFDGVNNYVDVGSNSAVTGLNTLSVSFWFKSTQTWNADYWPGSATLISKATAGACSNDWTIIGGKKNTDPGNAGRIIVGFGCSAAADVTLYSNTGKNNGNWHHVVWTRVPTIGGVLYVDGVMEDSHADNGTNIAISRPIQLGYDAALTGAKLSGTIDDVRIYNRALSAAEVAALYQADSGPGVAGIGAIKGVSAVSY